MITARILADSQSQASRITTFELRYPRFVHAEFMTHRIFSRNAASSRAIPIERMIADVLEDPAMPVFWGSNKAGMQAGDELDADGIADAMRDWLVARNDAIATARAMSARGLHKQIVNRILEPWAHITVIFTATDFANFYHLRRAPMAQPEIQALANAMWAVHQESVPVERRDCGRHTAWHLPLVTDEEREEMPLIDAVKVCVGRCARVSYLTHDGRRDPAADIALHDRLARSGHWSPFEHAACAQKTAERSGNFFGWDQARKAFPTEHPYQPGQVEP